MRHYNTHTGKPSSLMHDEKITKQCNQLNKCKSIISLWCQLKTHHLFDERILWRFRKKEHFKERALWCQLKFQKIIFLMMFQLKCCFSPILSWHRELSFHFCRSQLRTTGNPPVAVSVTVVTLTNTSLSKTPMSITHSSTSVSVSSETLYSDDPNSTMTLSSSTIATTADSLMIVTRWAWEERWVRNSSMCSRIVSLSIGMSTHNVWFMLCEGGKWVWMGSSS